MRHLRRVPALALACAVAAGVARAEPAVANGDSPWLLSGVWYVLVHYRDARAPDPDLWHWDDRVWTFRREDARVVWTEYLLVQFADNDGRFVNLGTNMAARVYGAWEPDSRQREEIRNGLRVLRRSGRSQPLEPDGEGGWRSLGGARPLAASAAGSVYLSQWSIRGDPARPVFAQVDELRGTEGSEPIGTTRYVTERRRREPPELRGSYERDGRLAGSFRMVRARIALGPQDAAPAGGSVRLAPGERLKLPRALFAWLVPWHYLARRSVVVDTTPPGAILDLAYLRRGTQLDYARAHAPVTVELPRRASATSVDVLWVRASADGYERDRYAVPVQSRRDTLHIELEPLQNTLLGVAHRSLAGHSALEIFTSVEPVVRSRRTRDAMTLVLLETRLGEGVGAELDAVHGPQVAQAAARQIGSDLVIQLGLTDRARLQGVQVRTFEGFDAARDRYVTVLDWSLPTDEAARVARLRAAVAAVDAPLPGSCPLAFERALRAELDPAQLHHALAMSPHFVRPTLRAALRRIAEPERDGRLRLLDGTRLDPSRPMELDAALERADRVEGLLAFLRSLIAELEPAALRDEALRGLLAPESAPAAFARALGDAGEAEARCRAALSPSAGAS